MAVGATAALAYLLLFAGSLAARRLPRRERLIAAVVAASGYLSLLATRPGVPALAGALVVAAAIALGVVLALMVRSAVALASFCLAASAADLISTTSGITRQLVDAAARGDGDLLLYLVVSAPAAGRWLPVIGIADLAVAATIIQVLRGLGSGRRAAVAVPGAGLLVALVLGLFLGGVPGVPWIALPTLAYLLLALRRGRR